MLRNTEDHHDVRRLDLPGLSFLVVKEHIRRNVNVISTVEMEPEGTVDVRNRIDMPAGFAQGFTVRFGINDLGGVRGRYRSTHRQALRGTGGKPPIIVPRL